jgi:putative inorganic carbon (hco3(-)) transporter
MNIKIGKRTNTKFYNFLSVLLIVYMISINNQKSSILSLIAILISFLFILNPIYILPPLIISSLLGEYFVAFNGIGMSRVMVIVFIIGSFLNLIIANTKVKATHFFTLLLLCGFNFVSAASSISGDITPAITMSLNIVMFFFMTNIKISKFDSFLKTMTISMLIFSIYILILVVTGNYTVVDDKTIDRLVLDSSVNSNRLGMALAQMSAFLFGMLLLCKTMKQRIFYIVIMFVNIINLLLTGSRSAFIAIVVSIIIVSLISLFKMGRMSKNLLVIALTIFLMGTLYLGLSASGLQVMQRFSIASVVESGGTGRTTIWAALIKYVIPAHLFFGVGLGGFNVYTAVTPYVPNPHGTHNILLSIIAETGIVGALIYISLFYSSTKTVIKTYMKIDYLAIPLTMILASFLNGIGEDIFSERFLWFALGSGLMFINNLKKLNY